MSGGVGVGGAGRVSGGLERRYRRLLAWYPAEHRRVYAEEMLGVLMAGARPGQRYPGWSETLDLLWAAVRTRLGRARDSATGSSWASAAGLTGALSATLLLALHIRSHLGYYVLMSRVQADWNISPRLSWLPAAGWAAIVLALALGRRPIAAALSWLAVLAQMNVLGLRYPAEPDAAVHGLWPLLLGLTAAVGLSWPGGSRGSRVAGGSGRRRWLGFAVVAALTIASSVVDPLTARIERHESFTTISLWPGGLQLFPGFFPSAVSDAVGPLALVVHLAAIGAVVTVVLRTDPPIRRRMVALLAPTASLIGLIYLFVNPYALSDGFWRPEPLGGQWLVLVGVPLATLALGVLLVHRRERFLHLVELGRVAQRRDGRPSH